MSTRRTLGLALVVVLLFLAACEASPPSTPPPEEIIERLGQASTDPVYYEQEDEGNIAAFAGRVHVPDSVPADPASRAGWFLDEYGDGFGVEDPATDLEMRDVVEGEAGTPEETDSLVTYDRTEDGVPVYGSSVRVEVTDDGEVTVVVSQTPSDTDVDTTPTITREAAIATAMAAEPGTQPDSASLAILNEAMLEGTDGPSRLVWIVNLLGGGANAPRRFVDAHTGELLAFTSTSRMTRRNRTTFTAGLSCDPVVSTQVLAEGGPIAGTTATADATNAHTNARTYYDYLFNTFRRDSIDGRGTALISTTDQREWTKPVTMCTTNAQCMSMGCGTGACSATGGAMGTCIWTTTMCPATSFCHPAMGCTACTAVANSFWDGTGVHYGEFEPVLDVVGHEMTHGLIRYTSNLEYSGQSGALNESFADVFGHLLDGNWLVSEGVPSGAVRDMANPAAFMHPNHFRNRYRGTDDHGGVHTNSGIPNYATYLASAGGTHPTSNVTVCGIGDAKMAQIWYRGLTWYMTSGSTFAGAKIALRLAAFKFAQRGMHGVTYNDCGEVLNAFGAAGIGTPDRDRDCFTDAVDNCPDVYNPMQDDIPTCSCPSWTMCTDCAVNDGCVWCGDGMGGGRCMADSQAMPMMTTCPGATMPPPATMGCTGPQVTEVEMCDMACSGDGEPCSGSGPAFDGECCEGLICVVGACRPNEGGREQASCESTLCAAGLNCGPVSTAGASPTCCARDTDYCEEKADCCGLMECVGNRCIGRNPGEMCILGDCIGTSFCDGGTGMCV